MPSSLFVPERLALSRRGARVAHMPSRSGVFADCAAGGGGHEGGGGGLSPFSLLKPKNNATSSACSALGRIGGLAFWVPGWARHLFPAGRALLRGRKPFAAAFRWFRGWAARAGARATKRANQIKRRPFRSRDISESALGQSFRVKRALRTTIREKEKELQEVVTRLSAAAGALSLSLSRSLSLGL